MMQVEKPKTKTTYQDWQYFEAAAARLQQQEQEQKRGKQSFPQVTNPVRNKPTLNIFSCGGHASN